MNFLWTTFTRFEPAADIHAAATRVVRHHVAYTPPIVIDARLKPWYPARAVLRPGGRRDRHAPLARVLPVGASRWAIPRRATWISRGGRGGVLAAETRRTRRIYAAETGRTRRMSAERGDRADLRRGDGHDCPEEAQVERHCVRTGSPRSPSLRGDPKISSPCLPVSVAIVAPGSGESSVAFFSVAGTASC